MELARVSYAPLAEVFRAIAPREAAHAEEGLKGLARIVAEDGTAAAQAALDYWRPRVAASFGRERSERFERLARLGLRHAPNETLLADWQARATGRLTPLGLH
jgi:1,2-phenylacetyl-CoA epoxidase catalytic subunit